ncbi:MAG: hypothetical protein AAF493_28495 [Pseudomonadota bacterium]
MLLTQCFGGVSAEPIQKGSRLFALAVTPPQVERPSDFWPAYERAFDLAVDTGIDLPGELAFDWRAVEKRSVLGELSYQDDNNARAIGMLKARGLPAVITVVPIATNAYRVPDDLARRPLDDPKVITRFLRFIDWVYETTADLVPVAVVLGNEFDIYLDLQKAAGNDKWAEFAGLVVAVRRHVKSKARWRDVPFALEATYNGLVGGSWQTLQAINRHADVLGVSYYPLQETAVHPPTILGRHLDDLIRVYPKKTMHFYQFGYPSSRELSSSLERQREFVVEAFNQWDRHRERIELLTFTWLYEVPAELADHMGEATLGELSPSQAFYAFIGSLGLHGGREGDAKPAFAELKRQLMTRGWHVQH